MRSVTSYDPKTVVLNLCNQIEVQCVNVPDKGMLRARYATESKVVNTGLRFEENRYIHSTLIDKIEPKLLPAYTLESSRIETRGLKVVTGSNGYVGVEGSEWYPYTQSEMEASVLDVFSNTGNFVDNVHPKIMSKITQK